ncbi:hypothetical protein G4B88_017082 [Cannabis sativa]|uniref:Uncharacterized protein n=1 Tax=Cannabis sativa TaxID=3483 RepID=A0A7J6HTT4_CANSA|nr:hypothetical protein G4B88_017082 [Cannabis sativa]
MASLSSSGLMVKLHPLVIVNISNHYTRVKSHMQPPHLSCECHANNNANASSDAAPFSSSPPSSTPQGSTATLLESREAVPFNNFELLYDSTTNSLDRFGRGSGGV